MNPELMSNLKRLRLSGLASTLEVRLHEAAGNNLNHIEFLELVINIEFLELVINYEIALRNDRAIARRIKKANFRELKSIEDFDFNFNTSIRRRDIMDLATCKFIREREDVLFLGPPGVGKSHLVQAIGHQAAKMGFNVLYKSIFDAACELLQAEAFGENAKNHEAIPNARFAHNR